MMSAPCAVLGIKMANHKVLMQPAYVLHQRAYRDTSALLELFSPEYGRVGVIAKGVKSAKSRWRGVLQPFQPLLPPGALQVSCKTREGVDALKAQLLAAMLPASAGTGEGGLEEEPT